MKPSDGKLAIFICGPVRYAVYVNRSIERLFRGYDYDCFYHIWKEDLGNKIRADEVKNLEEIEKHPRTKVFIRQEPYRVEDFAKAVGTESGSNSTVNATMGMFFSVNLLCHYLEQLPDFSTYRYILRLRTDCAVINPQFPSFLDPSAKTLTFAKSYFIPDTMLCDHLCFARVEDFFSVWRFPDMQAIYEAYLSANRHPETVLQQRLDKNPDLCIREKPIRFRDYHIVYLPTRDCEPACISNALNTHGVEKFFNEAQHLLHFEEIDQFNAQWAATWQKKKREQIDTPRFSFVMIVLNGMPFIEYSLKSIYEFAHEIIVVEGAVEKCMFAANPDGSSVDGTVEFLRRFPDPDRKIRLIQGRWPEKCEMQNAALEHVSGDYVWLIDSDEVYKREHLEKMKEILRQDPSITQVNFIPDNFWKGLDTIFVSEKFFEPPYHYRRLFRYVRGAVFTSHRPPTLQWPDRQETTEQMRLLDGNATRKMGIVPFHYSYVTDAQVRQKIQLYQRYGWGKLWSVDLTEWYEQCFRKWTPSNRREIESRWPVWTGDKNSYTQPFIGTHPEAMGEFLMQNKTSGAEAGVFPEDQTLPVIGSPSVQSRVLEAWEHIETDAPIQKRIAILQEQIASGKPFWNIHTALAYTAGVLKPRSYLEIGVRTGCSLVQVLANSDPQQVVGVDLWTGNYADLRNTMEFAEKQIEQFQRQRGKNIPVRLIQGNSHQILKELIGTRCRFDLITVDGDHSQDGAWEDLLDAHALLADQGAIVFDDIIHPTFPFLMEVVKRFAESFPEYRILRNSIQDNGCVIFLKGIEPEEFLLLDRSVENTRVCPKTADLSGSCRPLLQVSVSEQELSALRPETLVPAEYCDLLCQLAGQSLAAEGDMIEVGVYKGGTLFRLAEHILKNYKREFAGRRIIGIDTFSDHPYSDPQRNPAHHFKGRFSDVSYETVRNAFSVFNFVDLYQGECGEVFARLPAGQRFCLAHIDVDIAQSAIACIEYIYPRLMPGGILIFDEYKNYGQETFIDEFFKDKPVRLLPRWGRAQENYGLVVYKLAGDDGERGKGSQETTSSPAYSQTDPRSDAMPKRLKVAEEYVKKGMNIEDGSAFSEEIRRIFAQYKPRRIIETGTYLGQGTTTIIAEAMQQNGIEGTFFTIEVNPQYYAKAQAYLHSKGYPVKALHGLSVPRSLLPSRQEIQKATVETTEYEDIFVDHPEPVRAERYYGETDFPNVPDSLLLKCLGQFDGKPDFVLLDSGGHIGFIEFQYLLEHLKGPCILALDDIDHIKHRQSFRLMQNDRRFEILVRSKEKFGFCISRFTPAAQKQPAEDPRHILWLRPDAIGDGILASSMLPAIRRRFPSAQLTILVKDLTAPLYEHCPFVDRILHFSEPEMQYDPQFIPVWAEKIRSLGVDCILHSVYSRDWVMDNLVHASGVNQRIGMEGNCSNITPEDKAKSDPWYTRLIPSQGRWKSELDRHADFLKGLGCPEEPLSPTIWLSKADEAFAERWFEENKVLPTKMIVLFSGARTYHRLYDGYGQALAAFAKRHHLTVVALGSEGDFKSNQENLNPIAQNGVRTINLSGKLSLRESAAILKQCRLAVGAETSLAHMAAALKVPHIILIGGGHFGRFMPYSPLTTLAALPLDCYGCDWMCRYEQEKIYCIRSLEPFVLAEAIEQTYQKTSSKPRIFVQDASCYDPGKKGPAWKQFDSWIDIQNVEAVSVSLKNSSVKPTERRPVMKMKPIDFSIVDNPNEFTYSKKRHFEMLKNAALELYGKPVDPATCDLKQYQDLLVFGFIKRHVPKGSRILDVGGGDSRILNHFYRDYECWNIDPLEGGGNGPRQLDPKGRYRLVQDYMGKFNPGLPNDYFDFVFSISALEHAERDAQSLENIRNDINRVLKPGGYSFHLLDSVIAPDKVWIHKLVPSFFSSQVTANRWVEPETLTADPELYTMTKAAYEGIWMPLTKQPYEVFGKPFSYQVLWQKAPVSSAGRVPSSQPIASSAGPSRPPLPKITVVTPSYNQAPHLEACIQSVLNQGYPNLEYIIMDGGSTDGSVEIIKKYAPYLAYWQSKPDGGQYKAVEEGFARSTGQIMTWLNSDDKFFPDAFEIAATVFSERSDIEWLTGRVSGFNEDGSIRGIQEAIQLWCRARYLKKDYRSPCYIQQEGTFWRRSLWEKAGSRMRTDLHLAGDLELWNRFFHYADLHTLDAALAGYRKHPNQKTATLLDRYNQEADQILDEELHQYLNQPDRPPLKSPPPPLCALDLCRYRSIFRKKYLFPTGREPMALATSLALRNIAKQQKTVQSWIQAGYIVLSVNTSKEIKSLRQFFPQVNFITAPLNDREYFGKTMIYIDDILKALKETQFEIVGIIDSDIYLSLESVHLNAIARQTQDALVCVNRVNVKKQGDSNSVSYVNGFGAFFFRRWLLERIPASRFCLGMPWWDYYMPTVCILNQIPLVCFQDLIACQICHPFNWDRVQWAHEAKYFFEQLLELCRQQEGYHPFWNLGYKFWEAWKQYYLLLMNNCPVNYVQKSYFYAEFILGIIYGQMRALDVLSADRFERDSFSLPDISRVTHALMSPSLTLMPIDCDSGPLVSAIVSTYQAEEFIHGCLQDLIEQTLYKKGLLEIIVINSASPQNEGAIVRQFQNGYPNIRYIRTAQRETIYAAWNRGIQEARGKYITNANTDDRRHPQMLEMMAAVLEENTEKAAVYSHFYVTEIPNQNWNTKTPVRVADWHPPYSRLGLLKANFMGPQPMWRRTLHQEYGYFDPSFKVSGDWEFFLRVSQTHDFIKCSDVLGLYYFNPKSLERSAGTREIEDQFIRQLYIKNLNTIIRRPFNPQTECAFADAPEANRREFMPAQIEPSLISASCNSTSGQSEKDGERKALPAADSENSEQIPVEQKQNETLKQALFYFQLAMQRFEEKKLVSASRWMDQYRKSMDYKWLCPKRWKGSEGSCPALSVIVVTYNRHSELKNLLEDLQRQDFKDFEVLVVNNGSPVPDSCQELADLYIQCPLNLNLSEGRNIGVYFAQGQIGVFLDDDASVESGYLTSIASAFQTYEIAGMRGKTLPKSKNSGDSDCQIYNLGDRPFACLCNQEGNSAFRLDCWRAAGGMDPLLFGHEGSDLTARLIQLYGPASVIYWPQAIIYHDYGPTDKAREKQDRYWRNRQYLEYKFDADVIAIKDRLAQTALRRKGEGFVPGFAGLPPVDRSIQRSGVSSAPRVSILMTCYNAQLYLQECLDSLLGQTLQDWELIVIDDGSTDQTRNRLNHYAQLDPRIRVFCFDQQAGPYIRRNFAIQQARSELISIQDADDIAVPEKLEILCDEIERDPRLGIVGSFYRRFLEDFMPPEHGDLIDKMICHDSIMQAFSKCWHLCWHGSAVIRKELFSKIGLYDSHPWGSDTFWLSKAGLYARLTQSVRFKNVPECLTCKREHSQSQTGKISTVDPRGRRRYFEGFYLSKLEKIRDQVQQNPTLDAGALLRDCTSDDFVKYAENFSAFESEPMTKEMILQILKKAHLQFRMGQFVSALITLDYLAAADAPQYSQYIGADLIRGLCWFAIGQDGKARECLEREQESHPTSKAEEMLGLVKSGEANALPIDQRKQMVLPLSSQAEIHYREFRIKSFESQKSDAAGMKKAPSDPVVSVYIVAYNSEAYIGQTIESVLSQTYPNFELLIVDDGSTDQTASIIQTFRDPRIRHLRQEHKNFAAGMNRAIQAARGEFVIGVDSDDWIDPDYLSRMAEYAAAHPEYEYYYPEKLTLVDAHGNPTGVEWPYEEIGNSNRLPAILFARGCSVIPNSGSLKRRSMFARTGLFRELDNAEDFDFMVRCGTQVRFKRVDHSSRYYYRRLQKSNTARFEQRHPVTAKCMEWMLRNYPPTALCPKLSELTDPTEQEIQFLGYVISVFEKLAKVHRDQSGWIFEEYAQKYRQKKSDLSKDFLAESPIIQGSLQNQLSLAQVHMEQGDLEKAAIIYRQILSNKKLMIHTELRETIQGLLLRLEAENRRSQKVYN